MNIAVPRLFVDMDGTLAEFRKVTALEELYEAYVPAETRAYLDARCRPDRDRRRRPAASKATQMQKEEATDGDH